MPSRQPARWRTKFGTWMSRVGVSNVARELRERGYSVTPTGLYHWIAGDVSPRPSAARELVRISRGRLRLVDIYRHRDVVTRGGMGDATTPGKSAAAPVETG